MPRSSADGAREGGFTKKIGLVSVALSLAFASMAWAGAKDKSQNSFVDVNATGILDNLLAKTLAKNKGCLVQVQMKPVALADGDMVICLAEASVNGIGGNSLVMVGEAKKGGLKIKAKSDETGCGSLEAISFNPNIRCFQNDGDYLDDGVANPLAWDELCAGAGGLVITNTDPEAAELKENVGQLVIEGACQFIPDLDARIPPPSTPEFARYGSRTPLLP